MKIFRRALCAVLALCLCLSALGCARKAPEQPSMTYAEVLSMVRQSSDGGIGAHIDRVSLLGMTQNRIWAYGSMEPDAQDGVAGEEDPQTADRRLVLADMKAGANADGAASWMQLAYPTPLWEADADTQTLRQDVTDILFAPGGEVYVLVEETLIDWPQDDSDEYMQHLVRPLQQAYSLCGLTENGTLQRLGVLQLPEDLQPTEEERVALSPNAGFVGADGSLWLTVEKGLQTPDGGWRFAGCQLVRVSPDGACLDSIPLYDDGLFVLPPQRPDADSAAWYTGSGTLVLARGFAAGEVTVEELPCPMTVSSPFLKPVLRQPDAGDGSWLWWDDGGIWCADSGLQGAERVLQWGDYALRVTDIHTVFALADGTFAVVTQENAPPAVRLDRLKPIERQLLEEWQVVTVGILHDMDGALQKAIDDYNYAAPDTYVVSVDYSSQAAAQKGYDSGQAMLADDILHNTAPDIVQVPLNSQRYLRQGMFLDLYPYLDADGDIRREELLDNVLTACEYNGTLPTLPLRFALETVAVSVQVADRDAAQWTLEQFAQACAERPQLQYPIAFLNRDYFIPDQLRLGGDRFVDFAAGKCYLDTPAFIGLLQQSAALPTEDLDQLEDPKPYYSDGRALACQQYFVAFQQLRNMRYQFDGDFALVGLPNDSGAGNALNVSEQLAVLHTCRDPDAAWQFLRTLLLPAYQDVERMGFPVRRDALEHLAQLCQEDGHIPQYQHVTYNYAPAFVASKPTLSAAEKAYWEAGVEAGDVRLLLQAIENADKQSDYNVDIENIVLEELESFYAGQHDAQETAALLQSRIQLYLDEQS